MEDNKFFLEKMKVEIFICLAGTLLGVYAYFFKHMPFQEMIMFVLFCVAAAGIAIVATQTGGARYGGMQKINRTQQNILGFCGIIWGVNCLWIARNGHIYHHVGSVRRGILYVGAVFFGIGGIILLLKKTISETKSFENKNIPGAKQD